MKEVLKVILPQIVPEDVAFEILPHEGKSDLEISIPKKLKGWRSASGIQICFIIVRDQDSGNCIEIKEKLKDICVQAGHLNVLIRIVCHELENWFLGDLQAVEKAFGIKNINDLQRKAKYRNPDKIANAAEEIKSLIKGYQKIKGAKAIAPHMCIERNLSQSFNAFVNGVRRLVQTSSYV